MKMSPTHRVKGGEEYLQIQIPAETKRSLGMRAIEARQSMRVIVLLALKEYGIPVPQKAIADRRRERV